MVAEGFISFFSLFFFFLTIPISLAATSHTREKQATEESERSEEGKSSFEPVIRPKQFPLALISPM
jgi:hypothetical protein